MTADSSRSSIDRRQRYGLTCACGHWLTGNRRQRQSRVVCPECGRHSFVLPPDVYPACPRSQTPGDLVEVRSTSSAPSTASAQLPPSVPPAAPPTPPEPNSPLAPPPQTRPPAPPAQPQVFTSGGLPLDDSIPELDVPPASPSRQSWGERKSDVAEPPSGTDDALNADQRDAESAAGDDLLDIDASLDMRPPSPRFRPPPPTRTKSAAAPADASDDWSDRFDSSGDEWEETDNHEADDDVDQTYSLQSPPEVARPPVPAPLSTPIDPETDQGFFDRSELDEEWDDDADEPPVRLGGLFKRRPSRPQPLEVTDEQLIEDDPNFVDESDADLSQDDIEDAVGTREAKAESRGASSRDKQSGRSETDPATEQMMLGERTGGRKRLRAVVVGVVAVIALTLFYVNWQRKREQAIEDYRVARQAGLDAIGEGRWVEAESALAQAREAAQWIDETQIDRAEVDQYFQETHARNELSLLSLTEALKGAAAKAAEGIDPAGSLNEELNGRWLVLDCRMGAVEGADGVEFVVNMPLIVDDRFVRLTTSASVLNQYIGGPDQGARRVILAAEVSDCDRSDDSWTIRLNDDSLFLWCFPQTLSMLEDLPPDDEERGSIESTLQAQAEFLELEWSNSP